MELFSYCKLPFSNSNHLFALSLAMMNLGDLCCWFLDHFSSLEQVRASHWSGNGVIVSLDNSHCELAFKVGLGPRVIFSHDIRTKVHPCFRLILWVRPRVIFSRDIRAKVHHCFRLILYC
uniref:Uncharacterized protein n=1 Tax=Solanum tuberosum TaxID=4113 RepID=M0ZL62_SOLTU